MSQTAQQTPVTSNPNHLLEQVEFAAMACKELAAEFGKNPPPEMETLLSIHRMLVMNLCALGEEKPETIRMITDLMKILLDWSALEERRKAREFAEQKHRDQAGSNKASRQSSLDSNDGGIPEETLHKLEQGAKLL